MRVRRWVTGAVAGVLAVTGALAGATGAGAKGGQSEGWGHDFYLSDSFSSEASTVFTYGVQTDRYWVGDWDGNGTDTIGSRNLTNVFSIRNANSSGRPHRQFGYGRPWDVVLVGDWDGDGVDTLAVRRGNVYHVKNSLAGGPADIVLAYGRAEDDVLVGDWDADGVDTLAVRRGAQYFVKNSLRAGPADEVVVYGRPDDDVLVGDWDGDGEDTFTVRRGRTYYMADRVRPGPADRVVVYGRETDGALSGDWNGDGRDSLGLHRLRPALERHANGWVTQAQLAGVDATSGRLDARNGRLSHSALCPIPFLTTHAISCRAVNDLVAFDRAYRARFGSPLPINHAPFTTYRSYADQQYIWEETGPPTAARPGRSPHGYGLAIDFGGRVDIEFGTQPYLWLRDNGPRFGWHNMPWNREGGSNPEAWHFDYRR
ncbi:M15 family metallopeptidase [Georgenia satyanarayanai]|uniref:M15 family metallopeptidase n=1 Tax=Georgenia satyanarayanai TaxID=860221 RepID=UPI00204000CF|nr:M15 family metallopeptidase [Georgenia satyanarayanai]MCM3661044.1 M15 family metallopeptidase [Georgenia satyanarayanai]